MYAALAEGREKPFDCCPWDQSNDAAQDGSPALQAAPIFRSSMASQAGQAGQTDEAPQSAQLLQPIPDLEAVLGLQAAPASAVLGLQSSAALPGVSPHAARLQDPARRRLPKPPGHWHFSLRKGPILTPHPDPNPRSLCRRITAWPSARPRAAC